MLDILLSIVDGTVSLQLASRLQQLPKVFIRLVL